MPIALSASSVGLSRSSADAGGLAPTMSPASTVTVSCGSVALARFRYVVSVARPPAASRTPVYGSV